MSDPKQTTKKKQDAEFEKMRDRANEADLTSSPALNDDAGTDSGGAGDQTLPKGNRFEEE
ncbi:hypothetical protein [uncultured Algimonas sp.]|uniref:hypothetical protein n=1 Tax=uncultured Algimonas sp. TaxID=1547920 RepID=UPI0026072E29|nr:hypothetical protein [uncultured Algimonas sp.]